MEEALVKASIGIEPYKTEIVSGGNFIIADEPLDSGGKNMGFNPFQLLTSALASCTAITLRMYVERKKWDTGKITVLVSLDRKDQENTNFTRIISTEKVLSDEYRNRLTAIANACPTHKILKGAIHIETSIASSDQ